MNQQLARLLACLGTWWGHAYVSPAPLRCERRTGACIHIAPYLVKLAAAAHRSAAVPERGNGRSGAARERGYRRSAAPAEPGECRPQAARQALPCHHVAGEQRVVRRGRPAGAEHTRTISGLISGKRRMDHSQGDPSAIPFHGIIFGINCSRFCSRDGKMPGENLGSLYDRHPFHGREHHARFRRAR